MVFFLALKHWIFCNRSLVVDAVSAASTFTSGCSIGSSFFFVFFRTVFFAAVLFFAGVFFFVGMRYLFFSLYFFFFGLDAL